MAEEKMYSTAEAARRLGVTRKSAYRWYQRGEFPNARPKSPIPGSSLVIPESDIIAFEQRRDHRRDLDSRRRPIHRRHAEPNPRHTDRRHQHKRDDHQQLVLKHLRKQTA